jgi:hypothetical protein
MEDDRADTVSGRTGQRLVAFYEADPVKHGKSAGVDQRPLADASAFLLDGPAQVRVVYVTHPADERRLVVFSDYEEELARDKLNEALRVFTSLGASRIVAKVNRAQDASVEAHVGRGVFHGRLGAKARTAWTVAFDHHGTGAAPVDPRPLRYPDEPGFAAACEGVLRLGGTRYKIEITRTSQYGVDSELAARLKSAGFSLGVGANTTRSNLFVIEAVFGAGAAGELDDLVEPSPPAKEVDDPRTRRWRRSGTP